MSAGVAMRRGGFTLIEVLIGVLVLALGLLGLGAIIPVVVREQRAAADAGLGVSVSQAAEAYLRQIGDPAPRARRSNETTLLPGEAPGPLVLQMGIWDHWLFNTRFCPIDLGEAQRTLHLWDVSPALFSGPIRGLGTVAGRGFRTTVDRGFYQFNLATGDMVWEHQGASRQQSRESGPGLVTTASYRPSTQRLTLAERLWPGPSARATETLPPGRDPYRPVFVWDFIARRVPASRVMAARGIEEPEAVQVAVFVRRIDANIRIPRGVNPNTNAEYTLLDVLTGNLPQSLSTARRVPVAVDAQGLPTNAGFDPRNASGEPVYSTIQSVSATFDPLNRGERNVLLLTADPDRRALLRSTAVLGQRLVDNMGNVYVVRGVPDPEQSNLPADQVELFVEPAVPPGVTRAGTPGATDSNPNVLRQVIFTPQVPAAVRVFTVVRPTGSPTF